MILAIPAPFLTSIAFDRKWMGYDAERVEEYYNNAKNILNDKDIELGLFMLPCRRDLIFYDDYDEPGELFRDFFIARKALDFDLEKFMTKDHCFYEKIKLIQKPIVSWLDNGFGYFEIIVEIDSNKIIDFLSLRPQSEFDRLLNEFFNGIYKSLKLEIRSANNNLLNLKYVSLNDKLADKHAGVEKNLYWVHKIWFIQTNNDLEVLSKAASNKTLTKYYEIADSVWGWGDSIFKTNNLNPKNLDLHWRQGMLLAQYYHTILNDALRLLPIQIEKMRLLIDQGLVKKSYIQSEEIIYKTNSILIDFEMAKNLTAGHARKIFDSLVDKWETNNIALGVATLSPYLREIVKQASETLKSWSQASIETILFLSATIGFFGLSIAIHDYLIPSKERYDYHKMSSIQISNTDPLVIAGIIFLVGLCVFYMSKIGLILRLYRIFKMTIKKITIHVNRLW